VKATIDGTGEPAILQKICPENAKSFEINTPNGRVELPPQLLRGFPYMVLFVFLLIPMSIAVALLKGGVALLNPNLTKQLRQVVDSLQKLSPPKL
jgi:hypothetical protein